METDFSSLQTRSNLNFTVKMNVCVLSCFSCIPVDFVTMWTVAHQTPPSMGFSRQECWSGLPFPSPGDLSDPGIELESPALQADSLLSKPSGKSMKQLKNTLEKQCVM